MGPLTPEEVAGLLRSSATAIETELEAMPRELASWRPAEGEWCALEVVGHLIEAERRGFAGRIRLLLGGGEARRAGGVRSPHRGGAAGLRRPDTAAPGGRRASPRDLGPPGRDGGEARLREG